MTPEEYEEYRQDLMDEAREEELLEYRLRSDYDFFCDYNQDLIAAFNDLYKELEITFENYGWDFDPKDI